MRENDRSLYLFIFIALLGVFLIQNKRGDSSLDITKNEIMGHIRYLSHENRGGRYPGTRGSKDVISYMIKQWAPDQPLAGRTSLGGPRAGRT